MSDHTPPSAKHYSAPLNFSQWVEDHAEQGRVGRLTHAGEPVDQLHAFHAVGPRQALGFAFDLLAQSR